ncbi:hypothetical protein EVAR_65401_1 [Eumeta japonica]|uniref:Uncharacterized protein n=1 Tax=Eumeta variegata TaxID=151549 RepID=A0A4C1ZQF9_EUMVA|nr:hypothetical protein EVAR_65401_1 [Eumeta japonica]
MHTCESSCENIASKANILGAATPTRRSSGAAGAAGGGRGAGAPPAGPRTASLASFSCRWRGLRAAAERTFAGCAHPEHHFHLTPTKMQYLFIHTYASECESAILCYDTKTLIWLRGAAACARAYVPPPPHSQITIPLISFSLRTPAKLRDLLSYLSS